MLRRGGVRVALTHGNLYVGVLAAQMLDKAREYRFISSVGEAKVPGYENLHKEPTLPNRVRAQSIPRFDSEIQSGARKLYPRSRRRGTSN